MTRWLATCLVLIAGCASGPEGGNRRIGEPAETPHTAMAEAWHPVPLQPACIVNNANRPVGLHLQPAGVNGSGDMQGNRRLLEPGASFSLHGDAAMIRFASVVDGKDPQAALSLRSRLYHLPASPPAKACRWQISSDPSGRLDLFGTESADDR